MRILREVGTFGHTGGNKCKFTRSDINSISMGYAHLLLPTEKRHQAGFKYSQMVRLATHVLSIMLTESERVSLRP